MVHLRACLAILAVTLPACSWAQPRLSMASLCEPGEVDYPAMRVNFSMYMQQLVHRDVTWWKSTMMSDSIRHLAHANAFEDERNPAEACPLAVACAKLMMMLVANPEQQYQELNSANSGLHQVFWWIHRNEPSAALDLVRSGWPLVSLLGKLERVSIDYFSVFAKSILEREELSAWKEDRERLDKHVEAFEHVPIAEAIDLLTRLSIGATAQGGWSGSMRVAWDLAMASAYLALADTTRLVTPTALVGEDASEMFAQAALGHLQVVLDWVIQGVLTPFLVLASGWPVFRLMDRLTTNPVAMIRLPSPTAVVQQYTTHLFPLHEKVSDFVRICGMPYCDLEFAELMLAVDRSVTSREKPIWIVEVGANLGDCSLWAMAQFGPGRVKVVAFEPLSEAAALIRKSVEDNGWRDDYEVVEKAVTEKAGQVEFFTVGARLGNPFAHASTSAPVKYGGGEDYGGGGGEERGEEGEIALGGEQEKGGGRERRGGSGGGVAEAFAGFYTDKESGAPTKRVVDATSLEMALPEELFRPNGPPVVLKAVIFNDTLPMLQGAKRWFQESINPVVAFSALFLKEYADNVKAQIDMVWTLFDGYIVRVPQMRKDALTYQELLDLATSEDTEAFVFVAHKPTVDYQLVHGEEESRRAAGDEVVSRPEACLWGESVQQRSNRLAGLRGVDTYFT